MGATCEVQQARNGKTTQIHLLRESKRPVTLRWRKNPRAITEQGRTKNEERPVKQLQLQSDKSQNLTVLRIMSTWEVEAEGARVQGQPGLHGEFAVRLDYTEGSCFKQEASKPED